MWQTCNEFGWFQTTNVPGGVYGDENIRPLELSESYCRDAFGSQYTHEFLEVRV